MNFGYAAEGMKPFANHGFRKELTKVIFNREYLHKTRGDRQYGTKGENSTYDIK